MQIRYIQPGSQPLSFIEEAAIIGGRIATVMIGAAVVYWFINESIKVF
jgi:hypothetical protein